MLKLTREEGQAFRIGEKTKITISKVRHNHIQIELNRSVGEILNLGDGVEVTVIGTQRRQARIGIKAPKEIIIYREEAFKTTDTKKEG